MYRGLGCLPGQRGRLFQSLTALGKKKNMCALIRENAIKKSISKCRFDVKREVHSDLSTINFVKHDKRCHFPTSSPGWKSQFMKHSYDTVRLLIIIEQGCGISKYYYLCTDNGQIPLVQPRFTCLTEALLMSTQKHMFSSRNKKVYII